MLVGGHRGRVFRFGILGDADVVQRSQRAELENIVAIIEKNLY